MHNWDSFAEGMENQSIREVKDLRLDGKLKLCAVLCMIINFVCYPVTDEKLQADARHGNLILRELKA